MRRAVVAHFAAISAPPATTPRDLSATGSLGESEACFSEILATFSVVVFGKRSGVAPFRAPVLQLVWWVGSKKKKGGQLPRAFVHLPSILMRSLCVFGGRSLSRCGCSHLNAGRLSVLDGDVLCKGGRTHFVRESAARIATPRQATPRHATNAEAFFDLILRSRWSFPRHRTRPCSSSDASALVTFASLKLIDCVVLFIDLNVSFLPPASWIIHTLVTQWKMFPAPSLFGTHGTMSLGMGGHCCPRDTGDRDLLSHRRHSRS